MCHTFTRKTMGDNSPYIYNMYLKTFLICTFTQHIRHVNNCKQRYDSYGTCRLEMCCCEIFWHILYISNLYLETAALQLSRLTGLPLVLWMLQSLLSPASLLCCFPFWNHYLQPADFINGYMLPVWFPICCLLHLQRVNVAVSRLCGFARHGSWFVWKPFNRDSVQRRSEWVMWTVLSCQ